MRNSKVIITKCIFLQMNLDTDRRMVPILQAVVITMGCMVSSTLVLDSGTATKQQVPDMEEMEAEPCVNLFLYYLFQ